MLIHSSITERGNAMSYKVIMIIKAIVCLGFGPLLLFFPNELYGFFGATLGAGGVFAAREYGSAVIGVLLLTLFALNAEKSIARKAIVVFLFAYDAIALVATVMFQMSGGMNYFGWSVVLVYAFLTVCFGYLLIREYQTA